MYFGENDRDISSVLCQAHVNFICPHNLDLLTFDPKIKRIRTSTGGIYHEKFMEIRQYNIGTVSEITSHQRTKVIVHFHVTLIGMQY